ncbi:hypothetical protein GOODEAATRI_029609, partial [Goodea atripinnis]
ESFNIGQYHPPSPDLFSPSTSTSSFSETHFSPASPTGYNMKMYQPLSPDLYSPSPLFMAESVDANVLPEDKKVVVEDEVATRSSPSTEAPTQTLEPMQDPHPSAEDESNQGDEIDGWFTTALINTVKTAILHLFSITSLNYLRETCYGCITNHPSQRQHQCLEVLVEDYYQVNFQRIVRRLVTPKLVPAIQNLLIL